MRLSCIKCQSQISGTTVISGIERMNGGTLPNSVVSCCLPPSFSPGGTHVVISGRIITVSVHDINSNGGTSSVKSEAGLLGECAVLLTCHYVALSLRGHWSPVPPYQRGPEDSTSGGTQGLSVTSH